MKNIVILVASHKPDKVYKDDVYTPIHVGRAISKYKEEMADMIGDDTGDNISSKNPEYCELTATYWAWKNLPDVKYVGLCHYRRYFAIKFTEENIKTILEEYDVVLVKPYLHDRYNEFKLARHLAMEDECIFLKVIKKLYPEYEQTLIDYLYGFKDYPYNMFVMRKELFDKYCAFLFSILKLCELNMKKLPYTCSSRRLGYIAEYLLPIFCIHNRLRIKEEPIVGFIGNIVKTDLEWKQKIKVCLLKKIYDKHKPATIEDILMNAVLVGLKNDSVNL